MVIYKYPIFKINKINIGSQRQISKWRDKQRKKQKKKEQHKTKFPKIENIKEKKRIK